MSRNIVTLGLFIIAAIVLIGLFAPLSVYTSEGTCDVGQVGDATIPTVKLHLVKGQTISRQKELDSSPAPTGEGCRPAAKYVQYFF